MMVSEISRLGGLTPHTVRFYVRKGLLSPERQAHNGYQVYASEPSATVLCATPNR